ncbi:MAG: sulfotransferase [Nitrococcus sp.]|nr:sulfotransferase [Nitrococcus sp.]
MVYILGYGRSGSTLLERLIGAYPDVFSCGELAVLPQVIDSSIAYCACGMLPKECLFWREVISDWQSHVQDFSRTEYITLQLRYERLGILLNPLQSFSIKSKACARYAEYTRTLLEAIANKSGASVLVDSSKHPARAFALQQIPGMEVVVVHLVRDVRGVVYSLGTAYKKSPPDGVERDIKKRNILRSVCAWAITNYFCERVRARADRSSMLVRYEDYVTNPDVMLPKIIEFVEISNMNPIAFGDKPTKPSHQIAGNRSRMRSVNQIAIDETWRTNLSVAIQKGLYLIAWPFMRRYRYKP